MTRSQVALVRCREYELDATQAAIRRAVDLLGGMSAFVQPGQRVLLKPNLVRAMSPERAVTTHPTVVAAVARLVVEAGGRPLIVDSPGGPYATLALKVAYRKTEMTWAAEVSGAELYLDAESAQVPHSEGQVLHRLDVIQPLLDADAIINLPKLKTHNLAGLTLSVKNLFGLVPGALKISYHAKLQERERLCAAFLDILTYARPALNIMDAVVGMEGEGPSGGDPRSIGAILASADALALDAVAASLVGYAPLDVLTTRVAAARGLTSGRLEDLELLGDPLDALRVAGFRKGTEAAMDPGLLPRVLRPLLSAGSDGGAAEGEPKGLSFFMRTLSHRWVWRQLVAYPRAGDKCIGCGFCARHCPVNAITVVDKIARMDTNVCIRCYCCHELCPQLAVELVRPWLGRLFVRG